MLIHYVSKKVNYIRTIALKALDPATNRNNVRSLAVASDQHRTSGQKLFGGTNLGQDAKTCQNSTEKPNTV